MPSTRRSFLQASTTAGLAAAAEPPARFAATDQIQIALLGAGGMGQGDVRYALTVPGVKLV
ncbi:MAG: twin-arginine translocation signal domain-containing protein, partial [Acidobacteria bacterium]|nr:twin-arginine translocation signal domain-containing protein [Acidobacteriota bacterium]